MKDEESQQIMEHNKYIKELKSLQAPSQNYGQTNQAIAVRTYNQLDFGIYFGLPFYFF